MTERAGQGRWRNWAGNVSSRPAGWAFPATSDELAALVRSRHLKHARVKVVGNGHSCSPIAASDGATAISLARMDTPVSVDRANQRISVPAGMKLRDFVALAAQNGLALSNLGAIVEQTVAGAIATGTHGSGLGFGGLAGLTTDLDYVSGGGTVHTVSRERDPDRWAALAVGLGGLGILTRITFACESLFNLHLEQTPALLDETLERLDEHNGARHFGFWWFPRTNRVVLRRFTRTDRPADTGSPTRDWMRNVVVRNQLHQLLLLGASVARNVPVGMANDLMFRVAFGDAFARTGRSGDVVTSKIQIRHHAMEFALPLESAAAAVRALRRLIAQNSFPAHAPVDIRFSGPDAAWLGLSHGRRSCYIGVVVYQPIGCRVDSDSYFRAVDRLMRDFDGRPHWGKVHFHDAGDLAARYSQFDAFRQVREELDPHRVFANDYLDQVLGE